MSQLSPQDPGSGGDVQAWEMSSLGGWEPGWGAWQMARKCGNLWVPPLDSRPDLPGSVWSPCNWVSAGPSLHATLSPVGVPPLPGASTCLAHMTAPCVMSALGLEWEFLGKATGGGCRALEGPPPLLEGVEEGTVLGKGSRAAEGQWCQLLTLLHTRVPRPDPRCGFFLAWAAGSVRMGVSRGAGMWGLGGWPFPQLLQDSRSEHHSFQAVESDTTWPATSHLYSSE